LIKENQNLLRYFSDISINKEEKHELINEVSKDDLFRKFIYVLIDEKRSKGLNIVLTKFIKRINKDKGILDGIIYTTDLLETTQVKKIEEAMSKKIDVKVLLTNIQDKEIIGGIKVVVEDDV
jgi:ATP synthase F1 delta subunit